MPFIIAATDFSAVATNAVHYACRLALAQKNSLIILHAYMIPVNFSEVPIPMMPYDEVKQNAELKMRQLISELELDYPNLSLSGKVIYGDIIDGIDELTEAENFPWMVIVGNSKTTENATFLDSTMIQAFRNLKFPVLAVPPDTHYKQINKICFTYDNKYAGTEIAFIQLREISQQLNAELHILYVNSDVPNRDNLSDIDEKTKQLLERTKPHYHIAFDSDMDKVIQEFVMDYHIDWLIVMPRKHSFFESLFHKSHTKSIAHHIQLPLIALHES